jgi:gliding motility-associated-like protein
LFFSQPATVTPINWNGNFTSGAVTIAQFDLSVTLENYMLQRVVTCNQTHFCNTLHLDGPVLTCQQSTPIRIVAHRNPGCTMPVSFSFDTAETANYEHPDDTTLIVHYAHPYRGKVIATLDGCPSISDTLEFTITGQPGVDLGNDIIYCPGKSYRLVANSSAIQSYLWQDGTTDSIFLASEPGLYHVSVTDLCQHAQSDSIRIVKQNFGIALGPDTTLCVGQKLILKVPPGYNAYNWQPSLQYQQEEDNSIKITPSANTSYRVTATVLPGCAISDTINVAVETCADYLYFPNSFTPNNDGLNDIFLPVAGQTIERYELTIFNRWGQVVFMTRQPTSGWSGYLNGAKQAGTFVWQCKYQFSGRAAQLQKGTVTVIH